MPPMSSLLLQVIPVNSAGSPVGDVPFVRSGLLGFVGPVRNAVFELTLLYSFVRANSLQYLKAFGCRSMCKDSLLWVRHLRVNGFA